MRSLEHPEGATPLDPDEIDGLKLRHITTREELDRWEQENIAEAMLWLERRRNKGNLLTEDFIKDLHVRMFGKVWSWAGGFRKTNKNIGTHWSAIPVELRSLLEDTRFWIENKTFHPDAIATRFHHRLVVIHLFPNGNGRHSRLLTETLLTEVLKQQAFTWGSGDLTNSGKVRARYITALKTADRHDYNLLLEFVRS